MNQEQTKEAKRVEVRGKFRWELEQSDRVSLAEQANALIGHMVNKQLIPVLISSVPQGFDLSEPEAKAYDAALDYLRRQFDAGHNKLKSHMVESEDQHVVENHEPPKPAESKSCES
jgi:hypothetical protein